MNRKRWERIVLFGETACGENVGLAGPRLLYGRRGL